MRNKKLTNKIPPHTQRVANQIDTSTINPPFGMLILRIYDYLTHSGSSSSWFFDLPELENIYWFVSKLYKF